MSDNAINAAAQLRQRIACNRGGSGSFADFVLGALAPGPDDCALDLGSGLGAQLLPVAERVRRAIGLDVSSEMVTELQSRLVRPNASAIEGDMDDLVGLDLGGPFTLVYAVYSLHYSRDPAGVVRAAAGLLRGPDARVVVITPDVGNNETWHADLAKLFELPVWLADVATLGQRVIGPAFDANFSTVRRAVYEDRVRFASLHLLMTYYDACAPYCRPDNRDAAQRYFAARIARDGGYEIPKRSLALIGTIGDW